MVAQASSAINTLSSISRRSNSSGGAGTLAHLHDAITKGKADVVLAASIFHFGEFTIRETKEYLRERGVEVRL